MIALKKAEKIAILFGATGLVGQALLRQLVASPLYGTVVAFTRRPLVLKDSKITNYTIDFEDLEDYQHLIEGDDLFCCLGTTRQKAGSKDAFRKVDYTYIFQIAKFAANNKVNQFLLVSSIGADKASMFFYTQVKGQLETAIQLLDFWAIHIIRPSLLLGQRKESRLIESLAIRLARTVDNIASDWLGNFRPIEAEKVASAMIELAQGMDSGVHIHESSALQKY